MWFDSVRPFTPGAKKFALCLLCLQVIAVALMVNPLMAFSLSVAVAAILIKFYKIDPEPIFLLLLHGIVSVSMLCDPITTFAFIIVMVAAISTFGDYDLPTERVVIFILSVTIPAVFGKIAASIACIVIGVAIVLFRLRPLQPESVSLLALGSLAVSLLFNKFLGTVVVFVLITVITGLFVLNKVRSSSGHLTSLL
ncbi:hypothetical protein Btru_066375 [Bulinus truncatus]|nr:hypothetical protein Btru_066375 [Bulinus truncatus]